MEDERYDESQWDRYEDEQRWTGRQGRYSRRYDPYFESLNRQSGANCQIQPPGQGEELDFESYHRGPFQKDVNTSQRNWKQRGGNAQEQNSRNFKMNCGCLRQNRPAVLNIAANPEGNKLNSF